MDISEEIKESPLYKGMERVFLVVNKNKNGIFHNELMRDLRFRSGDVLSAEKAEEYIEIARRFGLIIYKTWENRYYTKNL